jgi:hypothetical protein
MDINLQHHLEEFFQVLQDQDFPDRHDAVLCELCISSSKSSSCPLLFTKDVHRRLHHEPVPFSNIFTTM